jgi:D-beta-D-heptose 7-phosphate kinase/D-beta-D-heptose 1-phosphate adenosyltransferase
MSPTNSQSSAETTGTSQTALSPLLSQFKGKRVLVVGDVMLDQYVFSRVERISPEAPVPVAQVTEETHTPGGAANVAKNIAALGGHPILVGLVGADAYGQQLTADCQALGIEHHFITDSSRPTIRKMRIIGQNQQLLRLDFEKKGMPSADKTTQLTQMAGKLAAQADILILSDYAKGAVTSSLVDVLRQSGQRLLIDPKPVHQSFYAGAYLLTPNLAESSAMVGRPLEEEKDWDAAGAELSTRLDSNVLLTLGRHGMALFQKGDAPIHFQARSHEVYDVSGAGDTVVATLALSLASGADLPEACRLSNICAGIKVGKFGTAAVTSQELEKGLSNE